MAPSNRHSMGRFKLAIFFAIAGFVATVSPRLVDAALLSIAPEAYDNGAGPDNGIWRGSVENLQDLSGLFFVDKIDADIEFATFAPGDFQNFLDNNLINFVDPNPSHFTYAYQVSVNSTGPAGGGLFTVGIDTYDDRTAPLTIPGTGDQGTTATPLDQLTQMHWDFGGELTAGETSDILFFSSPFRPEFENAQINSGLASPSPSPLVSSPAPEPATIAPALLAMCACGFNARRR